MSYSYVREPCSPYPRPQLHYLDDGTVDRSALRRARWLRETISRLSREQLEMMALDLAAIDQRTFEQALQEFGSPATTHSVD